jgi:hypothetical protein
MTARQQSSKSFPFSLLPDTLNVASTRSGHCNAEAVVFFFSKRPHRLGLP